MGQAGRAVADGGAATVQQALAGKVAVVTGAARGIGAEICRRLNRDGATVAFTYLTSEPEAKALEKQLSENNPARGLRVDVSDPRQVPPLFHDVYREFRRVDYLVNNASYNVPGLWKVPLEILRIDDWDRLLAVDLTGTFLCCRAAAPLMRKSGGGVIVNFASSAALLGDETTWAYNAAKVGVVGLTRSLARLLAPQIRVNAIAPGSIDSGWVKKWSLSAKDIQDLKRTTLLRRIGTPGDIAGVVAFLLSDRASYVTGQTLCVDGGMLL